MKRHTQHKTRSNMFKYAQFNDRIPRYKPLYATCSTWAYLVSVVFFFHPQIQRSKTKTSSSRKFLCFQPQQHINKSIRKFLRRWKKRFLFFHSLIENLMNSSKWVTNARIWEYNTHTRTHRHTNTFFYSRSNVNWALYVNHSDEDSND